MVLEDLHLMLRDTAKLRELRPDGTYTELGEFIPRNPDGTYALRAYDAQSDLIRRAYAAAERMPKASGPSYIMHATGTGPTDSSDSAAAKPAAVPSPDPVAAPAAEPQPEPAAAPAAEPQSEPAAAAEAAPEAEGAPGPQPATEPERKGFFARLLHRR